MIVAVRRSYLYWIRIVKKTNASRFNNCYYRSFCLSIIHIHINDKNIMIMQYANKKLFECAICKI